MIPISHFLRSNYGTDSPGPQQVCMVISMTLTLELSVIPTFFSVLLISLEAEVQMGSTLK